MSWIFAVSLLAAIAASSSQIITCFLVFECNSERAAITVSSMEDCCIHEGQPFGLSYINLEENQTKCYVCPVAASSSQNIRCFSELECNSERAAITVSSMEDCCTHEGQPFGLSYITLEENQTKCYACPVDTCGRDEDLIFLLDYSTSFRSSVMRGILGILQLISNALNSRPNIRDAAIHYTIYPRDRRTTESGYIYDYEATCENTVNQLDRFAGRAIDYGRSFITESFTALNFVAREVPFATGRRITIVSVTDNFSDAINRISHIAAEIHNIKDKASNANAVVQFFSIGIRSQNARNVEEIMAELTALADGTEREGNYIYFEHFKDYLLDVLVRANILCPSDVVSINEVLTENNGQALSDYIRCTQYEDDTCGFCGTSELKISCSDEPAVEDNLLVQCFRSHTCDSETNFSISSIHDCCKHGVHPFGLAFKLNGTDACIECSVEFGFVVESFTAEESTSVYQVDFAFFSGRIQSNDFLLTLHFNTETATENSDVSLTNTRVHIPQVVEQDELQITSADILFRLDPVAQEDNETFSLTFSFSHGILGCNPTFRNKFEGFVVDTTVATFEISEECYRVREGDNDYIPVIITKPSNIILENTVSFRVIPLTIDQAIEMGINLKVKPENQYSPIYADENDFNTTIIIATFPADERSNSMTDLSVPITVFDDDTNEANNQFFAVTLELLTAVNKNLISLGIRASLCEIVDNDPIAIGFQFSVYDFYEPVTGQVEILNVTIVKKDDRVSEQTFGLVVTFGDPSADINAATLQQPDQQSDFDYVVNDPGNNSQLTLFEPTQREANFSFTIFSDNQAEGTEGLRVTLLPQGKEFPNFMQPSEDEIPPHSLALVKIADADYVFAGFEKHTYTANETDNTIEVCVLLSTSSENITLEYNFVFRISTTRATADELDFDDTVQTRAFMRATLSFRRCITINLKRDNMFEFIESFFVNLATTETLSGVIINNSQSEVFILDRSGFSQKKYRIVENEKFDIAIVNAHRLQPNITLTLELTSNTAQNTTNYNAGDLTFTINSEKPNISFPLIDDNIFEVDECFQAHLILSELNVTSRLKIISNSTQIIIMDDDILEFSSDYAIMESQGFQNLTIRLNEGNIGNLSVILTVASDDFAGNATVGEDYTRIKPTNLTFTENVHLIYISVNIGDDELIEEQEYFELIVINVTVIDSMGTARDFSDTIGDRIKINGTTFIEDSINLKTIVVCYPTPQCEGSGTENETLESCCTQQASVFSSYYDIPSSILSRCQPCHIVTNIGSLDTTTLTSSDNGTVQSSSTNALEISLSIVFGAVVIVALILLSIFITRRYRGKSLKENRNFQETEGGDDAMCDNRKALHHFTVQSSLKLAVPKNFIVPSCRLKLVSTIGQGEFGMVYKGHIKSGYLEAVTDIVAVKTLKGFVEKQSVRNLIKECGKMYTFDHPHILKLVGVCMDGGPAPYVIMPFMENGSLKDYLQKERDNLLLESTCTDSELMVSVNKKLLDMCDQVAKGMEYLASKRIIHRDLAARNCMIDLNFLIKVADFGLAESLDSSKDYFRQDQDNTVKLPIKWLAPESIYDGIFSEKTDVWSFGVTCWEIFNGGKTPYPGIHPADLPQQLDQGLRLEKPNNAAVTDEIYSIMSKCWTFKSYHRPSFSELVKLLSNLLGGVAEYLELKTETLDTEL